MPARMIKSTLIAVLIGLCAPLPAQPVDTETRHEFPMQGLTVIETRRLDPAAGVIRREVRTPAGAVVDVDLLARREAKLRIEDLGRMTLDLHEHVARAWSANLPVETAFWLAAPGMPDFRLRIEEGLACGLTSEAARCVARDEAEAFFRPMTVTFGAELLARGYEVVRVGTISPTVIARIPAREVAGVAADARVIQAYHASDRAEKLLDKAQACLRTPTAWDGGQTGKNSTLKVMVNDVDHVSSGNPYLPKVTALNTVVLVDLHATAVAGNICSSHPQFKGVAKELPEIFSASGAGDAAAPKVWDAAIKAGISYGNCSWWNLKRGKIDFLDRYFDHIVRNFGVMMFAACGNEGTSPAPSCTTPSNAYNVISTGCYNEGDTPDWTDDKMADYSSYQNPQEGHEKPELAAPGDEVATLTEKSPWIAGGFNGTSSASPLTCGVAALLGTRDSNLRTRTYTLKAVLMASAWHNIEGDATLSDKDGVGGVHASAADAVVRDAQYVDGTLTPASFTNGVKDVPIQLQAGNRTRVCVVWFSNANSSYSTDNLDMDLDLVILDPAQKTVASSAHTKNPFEIVAFYPRRTGTYTVRLQRQRFTGTSEPFAVAWSDRQDMATAKITLNGTGQIGTTMKVTFSDRYHPGAVYVGAAALSSLPGCVPLPEGHLVPLAPDNLLLATLSGLFPGFTGFLDGQGNKTTSMPIPNKPEIRGIELYIAMASFRSGTSGAIVRGTSPAVSFKIN
jgi:hypothetical protein